MKFTIIHHVAELEQPSCKHLAYHVFEYPAAGSEDGHKGYTQAISASAFLHGAKRRNWTKTRLFADQWKRSDEQRPVRDFYMPNVPLVKHASLWDFYKYIGYDYKSKRWITPKEKP